MIPKGDPAEALRPSLQAGDVIDADAQDLGIELPELGHFGLVRGKLIRSDRCPGQGKERDDDRALSEALRKGHLPVEVARQGEIGGFLPDLELHENPPLQN
jgi:hypothetical protein